jgi:hypothetical protein
MPQSVKSIESITLERGKQSFFVQRGYCHKSFAFYIIFLCSKVSEWCSRQVFGICEIKVDRIVLYDEVVNNCIIFQLYI